MSVRRDSQCDSRQLAENPLKGLLVDVKKMKYVCEVGNPPYDGPELFSVNVLITGHKNCIDMWH